MRPDKTQKDHILAVVHLRKRSDYLRNHVYSYSNGQRSSYCLTRLSLVGIVLYGGALGGQQSCNSTVQLTN